MKYFSSTPTTSHILALEAGEEIIQTVIDFCAKFDIKAGSFSGMGAVSSVILAHYNIGQQKYRTEIFNEPMEIVSLYGNIARKNGDPYIHCHGAFSDQYMRTFGGHVKEAVVSATGEIVIRASDHELIRRHDDHTGLNLLHSPDEQDIKFPKHAHGDIGP